VREPVQGGGDVVHGGRAPAAIVVASFRKLVPRGERRRDGATDLGDIARVNPARGRVHRDCPTATAARERLGTHYVKEVLKVHRRLDERVARKPSRLDRGINACLATEMRDLEAAFTELLAIGQG